jgi:hypothetical protein
MSDLQVIEAVKAGNSAAVEELLGSSADVNQQDEQGWTPLNWAASRGDLDAIRMLVGRGADVSKVGRDLRTPYKIALAAGHADAAKFLREAEVEAGGSASSESERKYVKAYRLEDMRKYDGWREERINWKDHGDPGHNGDGDKGLSDDDVVFLHQDLTVTEAMWHDENVIFNRVTPEWEEFCKKELDFKVPDELDFCVSVQSADGAGAQ